jgi:hypothetical protein
MAVGTSLTGQHEAIGPNSRPMGNAVVAPPVNLELVAQVLQQGQTVYKGHLLHDLMFPSVVTV